MESEVCGVISSMLNKEIFIYEVDDNDDDEDLRSNVNVIDDFFKVGKYQNVLIVDFFSEIEDLESEIFVDMVFKFIFYRKSSCKFLLKFGVRCFLREFIFVLFVFIVELRGIFMMLLWFLFINLWMYLVKFFKYDVMFSFSLVDF